MSDGKESPPWGQKGTLAQMNKHEIFTLLDWAQNLANI